MGFDINITMELLMCPATGKPFYYGRNKETKKIEKFYELPSIQVPGKMCDYLVGRGHFFHAYTDTFNEKDVFNVSVYEFLEEFPSWEDVMKSEYYNDECGWMEEDHLGFQRTLEWCTEQDVCFRICWSY
jgi:hypothetical protein